MTSKCVSDPISPGLPASNLVLTQVSPTHVGQTHLHPDSSGLSRLEFEGLLSHSNYHRMFEQAVEGIFQTTLDGRYLTANPMLAQIYGYDSVQELLRSVTDIACQLYVDPQRRQQVSQHLSPTQGLIGIESQVYRKDGSRIWISENLRVLIDDDGHPIGYEGSVIDITARKQAELQSAQHQQLLQGVSQATLDLLAALDLEQAIAGILPTLGQASQADALYFYQVPLGVPPALHPIQPAGPLTLVHQWLRQTDRTPPEADQIGRYGRFHCPLWYVALTQGQVLSVVLSQEESPGSSPQEIDQTLGPKAFSQDVSQSPSGQTFQKSEAFQAFQNQAVTTNRSAPRTIMLLLPIQADQHFWGYLSFERTELQEPWRGEDIQILKTMATSLGAALLRQSREGEMRYQAFHDLLTGLPNRALFQNRLAHALAQGQRTQMPVMVMFLDLDGFKNINDTYGHRMGDRLLQLVAERISGCLREGDTVARIGGDEFTLLLPRLTGLEQGLPIAERIISVLQLPFTLDGQLLQISCSIGISLAPQHGQTQEVLLHNADCALYAAKAAGRNRYQLYQPSSSYARSSRASRLHPLTSSTLVEEGTDSAPACTRTRWLG